MTLCPRDPTHQNYMADQEVTASTNLVTLCPRQSGRTRELLNDPLRVPHVPPAQSVVIQPQKRRLPAEQLRALAVVRHIPHRDGSPVLLELPLGHHLPRPDVQLAHATRSRFPHPWLD